MIKIKRKYPFAAMPSSLIQQNFGENPESHGYVLWDISKKTGELVDIENEYTKLNFYIEPNFDYDNITFTHKLLTNKSFIKIHWKDISSNINDINEEKINNYFKGLNIVNELYYEKNRIYVDISETELLTENIDINDKSIQQKIFKEYLKMNGYDSEFIDEIIKIDDTVDNLIENNNEKIQTNWKIDKFWLDNFKSYETVDLDWKDMNGIIQLYSDENQQGKTTLLDGICYITHGTTLSTNKIGGAKTEKFGDQRFINNKRDLDYCSGGMILDINQKKYAIERRTEREWKTNNTISTVKTTVEYYKDGIIDDEHKIIGEVKTETQHMLDKLIVDFEDFIRLTLINSFNINELIAMDRATFIDSIIKDAGYDIFEKKLETFKNYKKTLTDERINLDIESSDEEIEDLKLLINKYKTDYAKLKNDLNNNNDILKNILVERDNEYRKFNKVDDDILNINLNDFELKIIDYEKQYELNNENIKINKDKFSKLKTEYDKNQYELLLKEFKIDEDSILNSKLKISQIENTELTLKNKLENIDIQKKQLVKDKILEYKHTIKDYDIEIEKLNVEFNKKVNIEIQKLNTKKISYEYDIKTLNQKLDIIKETGLSIKKEIKDLETSNKCPVCLREYDSNHEHTQSIQTTKLKLETKITDLLLEVKQHKKTITDIEIQIEDINKNILDIETGVYDSDLDLYKKETIKKIDLIDNDIELINKKIKSMENNDLTDLLTDFEKLNTLEDKIKVEIEKNIDIIKNEKINLKNKNSDKEIKEKSIQILRIEKEEVKTYESLFNINTNLELKNEKLILIQEKIKDSIKKYYDNKIFIEQNKLINDKINEYDEQIKTIENDSLLFTDEMNNIINQTNITKKSADEIKENIKKYREQLRIDEIHKVYQKCVHRDGLPFYLLMKSKDLINQELSDILSSVNFNVYFDDKMNLKMFMEFAKDVVQNTIEGSGAEKAFSAIALKLALRSINNNSRPNFLLLDEVTGNLKGRSIENFNQMLEKMKERIDKIIIIEQNHPINYEHGIEVFKDENGISSLKIK